MKGEIHWFVYNYKYVSLVNSQARICVCMPVYKSYHHHNQIDLPAFLFYLLLFLVYVNDIWRNIDSSIRLFADDQLIYRKITNEDHIGKLQKDLDNLEEWAVENRIKINPGKSWAIRFTKAWVTNLLDYFVGNPKIPSCAVPNVTLFCSSLMSYFPGSLLFTYFLNEIFPYVLTFIGNTAAFRRVSKILISSVISPIVCLCVCPSARVQQVGSL